MKNWRVENRYGSLIESYAVKVYMWQGNDDDDDDVEKKKQEVEWKLTKRTFPLTFNCFPLATTSVILMGLCVDLNKCVIYANIERAEKLQMCGTILLFIFIP